jgi:hypothetical protein
MTYKLLNNLDGIPYAVLRNAKDSIPFSPANTDYQTFKKEILAGAELQDDTGNVMTQSETDAFIATLP